MKIVGFVGFAGVVVFGLLYIVFFFKRMSLKIPVIGMAVFVLVLAASVIFTQLGIMTPENATADEPLESTSVNGELSNPAPTPMLSSEPALASTPIPESTQTPTPEGQPTSTPTPPAPTEEFKRILMGKWSYAYRENNMIYTLSFDFSAEGWVSIGNISYENVHSTNFPDAGEDEYGWYVTPMGHPSFDGNYSLTASGENHFTLRVTGNYFYVPDGPHEQRTYELTYVNDNTIRIDGDTFVRGSNYTLVECARIFGFDIEVEDTADNSAGELERILTGSWSNAHRADDMLYTTDFDFSAGGELHIGTGAYSNINSFYMEGEEYDEYGWFWAPMGHPSFYGNYSLTALGDNRFTLVTFGAWDYASDFLEQHTYNLTYVNDNTIRIDGETFVRGSNYTLVEYARIFGFDIEF